MRYFFSSSSKILLFLCIFTFGTVEFANAGTVLHQSFPSSTLERDYHYTIYLPKGYDTSNRLYPVVYLLHGASGDENDWPVKGKVKPTLDRLIAENRIKPMIVVMPGHKESWWVDGQGEQAETVLLKELFPHIEAEFRTVSAREGRAVAGLSAGGYATIRLILRFPELFAAGAALSPAIYEPDPPESSSARRNPPFQKNGAFDKATWRELNWSNYFDAYKEQDLRVPLYVNSGDRDRFDIYYHATIFYHALRKIQPEQTALRIVHGDHKWHVWADSIGEALEYMSPALKDPED